MVLALLIFFAAFEVFFLALIAFWALPVLGVLAWWEILAGFGLVVGPIQDNGTVCREHRI